MNQFDWNEDKNRKLKQARGVSFETIVLAIANGQLLDVVNHPNQARYSGQQIYVLNMDNYVYLVPFVVNGNTHFLKTIIPSRKATRDYLRRGKSS